MNLLFEEQPIDTQTVWEVYAELMDFYNDFVFTAAQVASETGYSKKTINRALHRLIQHKAIICTHTDQWSVKHYRLDEGFMPD